MATDDHFTEPFQPYEPAAREETDVFGYGYDSDPEADRPQGDVLWGRIGILGAIVLFAFVFGRCTGGGDDGVTQSDVDAIKGQLTTAQAQITSLEQDLNDLAASNNTPANDDEKGNNNGNGGGKGNNNDDGDTQAADVGPTSPYEIQSGDTFSTIAEHFYKNVAYAYWIEDANPGVDSGSLQVGQIIQVPDNPPPE